MNKQTRSVLGWRGLKLALFALSLGAAIIDAYHHFMLIRLTPNE